MDSEPKDDKALPADESGPHVYGQPPGTSDWRRVTRLALLIALVVWLVLFFLWNRDATEVSLVVTTVTVPLVWILLGVFLLGMLVMYLLMFLRQRRKRKVAP